MEKYLKTTINKQLNDNQFNKAVDLLNKFRELLKKKKKTKNKILDVIKVLDAQIKETAKVRTQWFIDSARRWSANGDFPRALSFLNIVNIQFLTSMIKTLSEQKRTILKYFVRRCIEDGTYQPGVTSLVAFLGKQYNHRELQTKLYLTRLIHHHMLSLTKKNEYPKALNALALYNNIQIPQVKSLITQLKQEVKYEKNAWSYLRRGIPAYQGEKIEVAKNNKKITVEGPITFNIQKLKSKGEFDIKGRVFFIRELYLTTLKKMIEVGHRSAKRKFKRRRSLYFALALYLFSQERFRDAQYFLNRINPGYYENKMKLYQKQTK